MKTIYLTAPGIDMLGMFKIHWIDERWHSRLVTNVILDGPKNYTGIDFNYKAGPVTRLRKQEEKAQRFANLITNALHRGMRVHIILHSNSANLFENALKHIDQVVLAGNPIHRVVFMAAAMKGDFSKSDTFHKFKSHEIGMIDVHVAGKDKAMLMAKAGRFLGYGNDLGTMTEREYTDLMGKAGSYYYEPDWGHNGFFTNTNWPRTKARLIR